MQQVFLNVNYCNYFKNLKFAFQEKKLKKKI